MEERDGIDFLCATIKRLLYIINRAFYIFCIPSELELESPLVGQLLVDREDDTIQMQMFRKTGFRGRPPIVFLQEQLKLYLEYGLTASKITKLFAVSSKTIPRRMAEFGLQKKSYSTLSDMET